MNELLKRLTSESPTFFKKVQALAITIGAIGGGILAAPVTLSGMGIVIVLPAILSTIATHMVAVGVVAAFVAKTTVADSNVIKPTDPNAKP